MPSHLMKYFKPTEDGKYQLSADIMARVTFKPAGDIRDHENSFLYDAVIAPHVVYHHNEKGREQLFAKFMSLSRGLVITDDTSFTENMNLCERLMLQNNFGRATQNWRGEPLEVIRELSFPEKYIPFVARDAITDFKADSDKHMFLPMRLNHSQQGDHSASSSSGMQQGHPEP